METRCPNQKQVSSKQELAKPIIGLSISFRIIVKSEHFIGFKKLLVVSHSEDIPKASKDSC